MAKANSSKGLGRGLGALLGDDVFEAAAGGQTRTLPISQIETCSSQPRKHFDDEALADLADSIRQHGIIQPLTVRKLQSGYYQIVAGERRWRAARLAGLSEVPVVIIEADDRTAMELALVENLQREDLNAMEEADGYQLLMENYGLTQEEAAERVGKSRSAVANSLRLLNLTDEVRAMVTKAELSGGHARALLGLKGRQQVAAAEQAAKQGLSVRETEQLVKKLSSAKPKKPVKTENGNAIYFRSAEEKLKETLGRSCRIVEGKRKGRIELDYYGVDDLNDLLTALETLKCAGGKR